MKHERPGIELSGQPLSFAEMVRIGSGKVALSASETGMARVELARTVVEEAIEAGIPVYGSTTGVGAMKDVEWSPEELDTFNLGLVRAHHFGTGTPFSTAVVRNAMAIRINTALTGQVGCTPELDRNLSAAARGRSHPGRPPHRLDRLRGYRPHGADRCGSDRRRRSDLSRQAHAGGRGLPGGRTGAGEDGAARQPRLAQHQCREFCGGRGDDAQCCSLDPRAACDGDDGRRRTRRVTRSHGGGAPCRHRAGSADRRMALQCVRRLGTGRSRPMCRIRSACA